MTNNSRIVFLSYTVVIWYNYNIEKGYYVEKAIKYFMDEDYQMAINLFVNIKEKKDKNYLKALFYLGCCYCNLKQYKEVKLVYLKLLNSAKSYEDQALYLHQLSMVDRLKKDYKSALTYNHKEAVLRKKHHLETPLEMATLYYETSFINLLLNQYDQAIKFADQALLYAEESHDKMTLGCVYRVLGDIYKALDCKSDCRKYYESSLRSFIITGDNVALEEIKSRISEI